MWTIDQGICLLYLVMVSVRDIQVKRISVYALLLGGVLSVTYQFMEGRMNNWLTIGGILVGTGFLLVSKVTHEGMGYGDSWLILILGSYLGIWQLFMVLSVAFFLLLCVSIPALWIRKMSRSYTLPFLPFLTGGYLCFLLTGGVSN